MEISKITQAIRIINNGGCFYYWCTTCPFNNAGTGIKRGFNTCQFKQTIQGAEDYLKSYKEKLETWKKLND